MHVCLYEVCYRCSGVVADSVFRMKCMHTLVSVNNPVIDLDEDELRQQAAEITSISTFFSDPSFAQVAPAGLVLPGDENTDGAATVFFSFTLLLLLLIAGFIVV